MEIEYNEVIDSTTLNSIDAGDIFYLLNEYADGPTSFYIKTDSHTYVDLENGREYIILTDSDSPNEFVHVCNNVKLIIK